MKCYIPNITSLYAVDSEMYCFAYIVYSYNNNDSKMNKGHNICTFNGGQAT